LIVSYQRVQEFKGIDVSDLVVRVRFRVWNSGRVSRFYVVVI
jgi:hypothetical protein